MAYKEVTGTSDRHESRQSVIRDIFSGTYSDLIAVMLFYSLVLIAAYTPHIFPETIRLALGLTATMFLPGYAFIAAVFPGKIDLNGVVRVLLSVTFSMIMVAFLAFLLNMIQWDVRLNNMVIGITLLTLVCMIAAYGRRKRLPRDGRLTVDFTGFATEVKRFIFPASKNKFDTLLSFLLICALVISVSTVALAFYGPKQGEKFTELYVLGPEGKMDNYPTLIRPGEPAPVIVGISNHEGEAKNYDLMVTFYDGTASHEVLRKQLVLADNQTSRETVDISPQHPFLQGTVQFKLYMDGNTQEPYRECILNVNSSRLIPERIIYANETSTQEKPSD